MIKKIVASIILILALCGVPFTLFAQGVKCTISGKVIDQQNSPVAYASVAIYQDKTRLKDLFDKTKFQYNKEPTDPNGHNLLNV